MTRTKERKLPSRYGRNKDGRCYWYVIQTTKRDRQGRRLYRLRYLVYGVIDRHRLWTAEELLRATAKWLKRAPSERVLQRAKNIEPSWRKTS